jgi:O-Antigen ligase
VHVALGSSMIVSFCFPCYWKISIATIPISVQSGACVACFVLYLALGGSLRFRLSLCDVAIGAMAIAEAVSDGWTHKGGASSVATAYGEWVLPYAAGRYAFGSISRYSKARFQIAAALGCMFLVQFVDLTMGRNLAFELTTWFESSWMEPARAKRFGLVRSAGLTEHPIFYSGVLMALLPIAVTASAKDRWTQTTRRYVGFCVALGVLVASLSRGAVLAVIGSLVFRLAVASLKRFVIVSISVFALTFVGWAFWPKISAVWMATGDFSDRERIVIIDGEASRHSSSLARLRVFDVYGKAAARAGLFGYGTSAFATSPPNLPHLPVESMATETVWTVENSYLLILLRFGYVGLTCFVLLVLSAVLVPWSTRDLDLRRHLLLFATGSFSIALLLGTVYASYQIIFPMLFLMGLGNGLIDPNVAMRRKVPLERS